MSKVAVWARIPLKPGVRAQAAAALQVAIDNAEREEGTLLYILHENPADPDALFFYDLYADNDALTAHSTGEGMKALTSVLREYAAGRAEMQLMTPLIGKGL